MGDHRKIPSLTEIGMYDIELEQVLKAKVERASDLDSHDFAAVLTPLLSH